MILVEVHNACFSEGNFPYTRLIDESPDLHFSDQFTIPAYDFIQAKVDYYSDISNKVS